ncbi:MAG: recombinase family protein, partial [Patescibacteria group bacterium]
MLTELLKTRKTALQGSQRYINNDMNNPRQENAVAAIRISSLKQGLQGDSPEAQKEQIERFALAHNIHIKKFFIFMESASKEEQPVQEAIDYCENQQNDIQLFIIKSIDRFTRGGSYLYDHLKMQLIKYNVRLVDIYGIIGSQDVNTLEHLNISYNWSVYSPTKKSEILEAERAKDEMRDIMTRMIGAEIRYVRLGFRVRRPPFGYVNEKVETSHGKRVILKPHPEESKWIIKMFDLRCGGIMSDRQIVEEVNALGYKTRTQFHRNPQDRTKVIGRTGGKKLILKQFWRFIENPIYAGMNIEKWTDDQPIKGKFDGLVSIDIFNRANKGKLTLIEENGEVRMIRRKPEDWRLKKGIKESEYPYKKYVLCPMCSKPFYASASKGKRKHYGAYHCNRGHEYYRIPVKELEETVTAFVKGLNITPEYVDELKKYVVDAWNKYQTETQEDTSGIDSKILELKGTTRGIVEKMHFLTSEVAIKYMEEDLVKTENEIKDLEFTKAQKEVKNPVNMEVVMEKVGYFLEHLEELLIDSPNPLKRGAYFGLVFDKVPTYQELQFGTPQLAPCIGLKDGFKGGLLPFGESAGIRTQDAQLKRLSL